MKYVLTVVFVIVAGLLIFLSRSSNENLDSLSKQHNISESERIDDSKFPLLLIGSEDAPVTIYEYADFKCPECSTLHQGAWKSVRREYVDTGRVNVVFRPYPISSIDGLKALQGSYCAQEQGKFEIYYDTMFSYMWDNHFVRRDYQKVIDTVFSDDVLRSIVERIGIDPDRYFSCLQSDRTEDAYFYDIEFAGPDEVQGTPSIIIGDQKVVGPQPFSVYKTLLDIELR